MLKSPTRCLKSSICSGSPRTRGDGRAGDYRQRSLALRDDIDLAKNKLGIYSRPVKLHDEVHDGDRVEIYRPLIADPKELRRQRAEKAPQSNLQQTDYQP